MKITRRQLLVALGAERQPSFRFIISLGLLIFFVSFITKSLMALDLTPSIYRSEQASGRWEFERDATSIMQGRGILIPDDWDASDTSLLFHAPGYSIFLSGVYSTVGHNPFNVQFIQNLINSTSSVMVFLIAGTLLTWRIGAIGGLLTAISHHLSYYSNYILPDSLSAFPILVAIYLLAKFRLGQARPAWVYMLGGFMIGISVWLRPNALLLGPFLAFFIVLVFGGRWREMKRSWIIAVVAMLVVAPITIRNYIIYHEFVPVSANLGIVLWEGIGDASGDRFGAVITDQAVAEQEAILYGNPGYGAYWASPDGVKRDRQRINRSREVILSHPLWFATTMLGRMGEMFKYSAHAPLVYRGCDQFVSVKDEGVVTAQLKDSPEKQIMNGDTSALGIGKRLCWMRPLVRVFQRIAKETLPLFAIIGLFIVFMLSRRRTLFLLGVPIYFLLFQSIVHLEFRYTLPIHYFVFIFAATAWVAIAVLIYELARKLTRRVSSIKA